MSSIKNIKNETQKAVLEIIKAFEEKQELTFEFFVGDDLFGVACFGCVYYFNTSDIYFDIVSKQPKHQIINWLEDSLENQNQTINYLSYCKGLRFEKINMKKIIIDIDGTVSKVGDRLKYLQQTPKDWDAFYNACFEDEPINEIVDLLHSIQGKYEFVFCTGRRESVRKQTQEWLKDYMLYGDLLMRKDGDFRHDTVAKLELIKEAGIDHSDIAFVLEDRNSMVEKWRSLGVKCLQVADGNF